MLLAAAELQQPCWRRPCWQLLGQCCYRWLRLQPRPQRLLDWRLLECPAPPEGRTMGGLPSSSPSRVACSAAAAASVGVCKHRVMQRQSIPPPPHARKLRSICGGTCIGVALDLDEVQWIVPALPLERRGPSRQTVVQDASPASAHTHSSSAKTVADINRACSCWHISPHPTTTECKNTALTTNTLAIRPLELPQHRTTPRQTRTFERVEFAPAPLPTSTSSRRRLWTRMDAWCVCWGVASADLFTSPSSHLDGKCAVWRHVKWHSIAHDGHLHLH